jgi:hypothetical protein
MRKRAAISLARGVARTTEGSADVSEREAFIEAEVDHEPKTGG